MSIEAAGSAYNAQQEELARQAQNVKDAETNRLEALTTLGQTHRSDVEPQAEVAQPEDFKQQENVDV